MKTKLRMAFGWAMVALLALVGCGKDEAGKGDAAGKAGKAAGEKPLIELAATPPVLDKGEWQPVSFGGLTFLAPGGDGWKKSDSGGSIELRQKSTNITLVFQSQDGILSNQRAEYTPLFIEVNERDAPQYAVTAQANGSVAGFPAVRIEATFDNGKAHTTRDYLLFAKGRVILVMGRVPNKHADQLVAIVDYIAASAK
ncbi:MAG: hypothetical protein IPL79_00955 [Myxococcales bacterium]|nr:hypothetical protein [Myxococcales bacterium]